MMGVDSNQISSIDVIEESMNMVLFVHQRNCSHPIVVKGEDGKGRQNVGAMLEFHATAFSKLRALPFQTERLTLQEIDHLKKCDPNKINKTPNLTKDQWLLKLGKLLYGKNAMEELDPNRAKAVVKLNYVEELADVKGLAKKANQKQQLKTVLEQAGREASEIVFALGQILAVDFFIGNHDRFRDNTSPHIASSAADVQAFLAQGSIIGEQNVFFSFKNGKITPIGLDTFDSSPNNPYSDMGKTIEELESIHKAKKWPGRILARGSTKARDAAASALVASLASLVGANLSARGNRRLRRSCHKGISEGKTILRAKYNLGPNLYALSDGIRSRWSIIGGR